MNRRKFFGAAAGTVPALGFIATAATPGKFLGPMTVEKWMCAFGGTHHVLLDGINITDRCKFFNDRKGYALVYKLRGGHPYVERNWVVTERLFGKIEVVKARPA
jgi:hypothetical protein